MATSCTIINLLQLIQTASKKIAALTILFVNTFFISARAQNINYSFENPNGIPGISENYINVITQDKTGFIWIGSDDGLAKFDGYNTVVYRHKADDANSIPDDQILALLPDDDGNLWIGTRNGLSKYDSWENKFENFFHDSINSKSLAGNHVYGIAKDKDGNIWICGLNVLARYDEKNKTFVLLESDYSNDHGIYYESVNLFEDRDRNLWACTNNNGLYVFNPSKQLFNSVSHIDRQKNRRGDGGLMCFAKLDNGDLLAGSWGDGLYRYVPEPSEIGRVTHAGTAIDVAAALVSFAVTSGGHDNVTVVVMPTDTHSP